MSGSRWRAPREDGATLVVPDWQHLPELVTQNQHWVETSPLKWGSRTLHEIRDLALSSAQTELNRWQQALPWSNAPLQRPLIVTGHQPELFHPGVLAKNIAIHRLAALLQGSSLNINVDSDVSKTTLMKLPTSQEDSSDTTIAFSKVHGPLPYEEWIDTDASLFTALPETIAHITDTWPWKPVLPAFWQEASRWSTRFPKIPERWILARSAWERQLGVGNHELTMSQWCNTPFFQWLLEQFIDEHQRFACIYNDELRRYRKEHRIRSNNHPVADLLVTDNLVELPFWAWQAGTTQRGRLCIKTDAGKATLVALLSGKEQTIGTGPGLHLDNLAGWKIRPKALITSMMFRLFLADLFVHGIGGAVYDELTDRIFARFWNTALPRYAIVTATLRLPWEHSPTTAAEPLELKRSLRDMQWNPDRHLSLPISEQSQTLRNRKHKLLKQALPPAALRDRHLELESIRSQLQPVVQHQEATMTATLQATLHQLKRDDQLFSREHPWVYYPAEMLKQLVDRFDS